MATRRELANMLGAFVRAVDADKPPLPQGVMVMAARKLLLDVDLNNHNPQPWTPFERRTPVQHTERNIQLIAQKTGRSVEEIREIIKKEVESFEVWVNSRYQVLVYVMTEGSGIHLSIRRIDQDIIHDWRDLQRIKNELVGRECEAIELYPANSRLVDAANQYHLWASRDPSFRYPVGYTDRMIDREAYNIGEGQRPFEEGWLEQAIAQISSCPNCGINWRSAVPAKVHGTAQVRCVECKSVFPLDMIGSDIDVR